MVIGMLGVMSCFEFRACGVGTTGDISVDLKTSPDIAQLDCNQQAPIISKSLDNIQLHLARNCVANLTCIFDAAKDIVKQHWWLTGYEPCQKLVVAETPLACVCRLMVDQWIDEPLTIFVAKVIPPFDPDKLERRNGLRVPIPAPISW